MPFAHLLRPLGGCGLPHAEPLISRAGISGLWPPPRPQTPPARAARW
jgi:hypothetical protein